MYSSLSFLSAVFLSSLVAADTGFKEGQDLHTFQTRPDLKPPKWNVTYYDRSKVAPGLWFVSPYNFFNHHSSDIMWQACEVGPAIYDQDGELVWSGACDYGNKIVQNFQVQDYWGHEGKALTAIVAGSGLVKGGGTAGIWLGSDYKIKSVIKAEEFHEFAMIDGGDRVIANLGGRMRLPYQGFTDNMPNDLMIERTGFREMNPRNGHVFFDWKTHEHVGFDESTLGRPTKHGAYWEPFHLNSVDKLDNGNYLVSIRHADLIILVDGRDGHVIWRAGGVKNDFQMENGVHWSRQHDARIVSHSKNKTVISMLDNAYSDKKFDKPTSPSSRGLVVELNHPEHGKWVARLVQRYDRPDGDYAPKRGNLQQLPNDNVFMCWTDGGYISEHANNGDVLMEAKWLRNDRFGTYRGFKFDNWVGRPTDKPKAKAIATGVDDTFVTTMYVSWNGATEVKHWDFYSENERLGRTEKKGFETSFVVAGNYSSVRAEALDKNGKVLGTSFNVDTEYPYEEPEGSAAIPSTKEGNVKGSPDKDLGSQKTEHKGTSKVEIQSTYQDADGTTDSSSHNSTAADDDDYYADSDRWLASKQAQIVEEYPWIIPANIVVLTAVVVILIIKTVPRRYLCCLGSSWLTRLGEGYNRVPSYEWDKLEA